MSLRSFIGLCEHRWQDEARLETYVANAFRESSSDSPTMMVAARTVQRCRLCGSVRSVRL